ncbi:hypothetical protein ABZX68_06370 [Streptomyces cellulosae]
MTEQPTRMKCGEPMPGSSYRTCDRNLRHNGDHSYLGDRWPRLVPAEPDWRIHELLEDAMSRSRTYTEGPSYPVIVTETVTRVIWVEAENEDEALAYYADDYTDVPLQDSEVLDADLEFERPDKYQREAAFRSACSGNRVGPLVACPGCGATAFRRAWFHNPYRKCHGPIQWRQGGHGRPMREFVAVPVGGSRQAVTA